MVACCFFCPLVFPLSQWKDGGDARDGVFGHVQLNISLLCTSDPRLSEVGLGASPASKKKITTMLVFSPFPDDLLLFKLAILISNA
jgi:hypothetical protein